MKKLILLAIAGLFFAANSNAQVQKEMPKHQHVKSDSAYFMHRGKMMQDLNLTADQKTQMKALHQEMQQQRNAIKNDSSLSADQKKEKMKELHKAQSEKMKTILTPDQQAKMKAFREQRKQNHKGHKMDNKMSPGEQS